MTKLETIDELDGLFFNNLTDFRKDKFFDVTIDVIILHPETTEDVKNQMFDRINTSNPLKIMELRRGSYAGPFNALVRECGEILKEKYSDICPINTHFRDRREEEELALRFFAFSETFDDKLTFFTQSGKRVSEFNEGNEDFLTKFYQYQNIRLKDIEKSDPEKLKDELDRMKQNFEVMLSFVKRNFERGFRKA